ncbi:MAG: hypothetical protein A2Z88_02855 [Omnitrophica WOR_2 bacterium GWA2_47_8]|nr:MAG: hypothetical protein A2Z88_02855 [Omnitrophica WOR_2 bacterium GWA2_47_8]
MLFRKFKKSLAFTLISSVISFASPAQANPRMDTPFQGFHIKQEIVKKNHVLVSRPNQTQINILEIIDGNKIKSLKDYVLWLQKNIAYKRDSKEAWSMPKETLQNKYGDCEDYAFLNQSVLQVLGYRSRVLGIKSKTEAHAICLFEYKGHYLFFDNAKLKTTSIQNMDDFSKFLNQKYGPHRLFELNQETKRWKLLYAPSQASLI